MEGGQVYLRNSAGQGLKVIGKVYLIVEKGSGKGINT